MTVTNITNVEKFFETINKCEGKVERLTFFTSEKIFNHFSNPYNNF